jgi:tripeptide aminopeptidase
MRDANPGRERLIQLMLEMAAIEGLSGEEGPVAAAVSRHLRELGFEVDEEPAVEGGAQGNLVCRIDGGGKLVLACHLDTARSTAGLRPIVHADRLTSDGSTVLGVDNRAGLAVLLRLAEAVSRQEVRAAPFSLAFTVREETDLAGSRSLEIDPAWQRGFVFDSSLRPGKYIHGSYGAKRFEAWIEGRAAHAGIAPERGVDAIRIAAEAISRMRLGRLDAQTTANIGRIRGGGAINTVPDEVRLLGEVRALTEARVDQVIGQLVALCEQAADRAGGCVTCESAWDFHPFELAPNSPPCRELEQAIVAAGLEPEPVFSSGGSDANWLNARGLPTLNIGIGAQNPHSNDEMILLEDLAAAADIAVALVRS